MDKSIPTDGLYRSRILTLDLSPSRAGQHIGQCISSNLPCPPPRRRRHPTSVPVFSGPLGWSPANFSSVFLYPFFAPSPVQHLFGHGLCWKKVMTHPSPNFRRPAFIELLHVGVRRSIIIAPIDVVPLFPLVAPLSTLVGNGLSFLHCFCCSKFFTRVGRKPTAEPSSFILAWDRRRFCT